MYPISYICTRIGIDIVPEWVYNGYIDTETYTRKGNRPMKKPITVTNLTLDLYLKYIKPAARAAGIVETVRTRNEYHEYNADVIEETAADEIEHCMYCACLNAHLSHGDYTSEGEARQMLYQLEVSAKYDLHHTAETITALHDALSALLNPAPVEEATEPTQTATEIVEELTEAVKTENPRSAWGKGVKLYALELLEHLEELTEGGYIQPDELSNPATVEKHLLNGAKNWVQYSEGGCALIYNADIAKRLCTPSELNRVCTRDGLKDRPNPRETWLDCQARALYQASELIKNAVRKGANV